MIKRNRALAALAGLAVACITLVGCSADTNNGEGGEEFVFQYATYANNVSDQSRTVQRWAERIEELTDGKVRIELHYSESLVGAEDSAQAVLDGRTDFAHIGSFYAASELPALTVAELPFESVNPDAQLNSVQRLYEENQAYRANFDAQGIVQLFPLPLGNAVLGTNEEVRSVDDLRGLSIRSGGLISEVILAVGANPVAMSATDVYESMERGVIDGYTSLALASVATFGVAESTAYIADPGVGSYSASIVGMSSSLFDSLPESYQQAILQASSEAIDIGLEELHKDDVAACEQVRAAGAVLLKWDDSAVAELRSSVTIVEDWVERMEGLGLDANSVLQDYRRVIEEVETTSSFEDGLTSCMSKN